MHIKIYIALSPQEVPCLRVYPWPLRTSYRPQNVYKALLLLYPLGINIKNCFMTSVSAFPLAGNISLGDATPSWKKGIFPGPLDDTEACLLLYKLVTPGEYHVFPCSDWLLRVFPFSLI